MSVHEYTRKKIQETAKATSPITCLGQSWARSPAFLKKKNLHTAMEAWRRIHPFAKKLWNSLSFTKATMKTMNPIANNNNPENEFEVWISNSSLGVDPWSFIAVLGPWPNTETSFENNIIRDPLVRAIAEWRTQIRKNEAEEFIDSKNWVSHREAMLVSMIEEVGAFDLCLFAMSESELCGSSFLIRFVWTLK